MASLKGHGMPSLRGEYHSTARLGQSRRLRAMPADGWVKRIMARFNSASGRTAEMSQTFHHLLPEGGPASVVPGVTRSA